MLRAEGRRSAPRDYWVTLGMPGLGQLPSAFCGHCHDPKGQPAPEPIHQHEGRGTTSSKTHPCDCSRGKCQGQALLGHVLNTWLPLPSHLEQLLFAQGLSCASHEHSCAFGPRVPCKGQIWVCRVAQRAHREREEGKVPAEGTAPGSPPA